MKSKITAAAVAAACFISSSASAVPVLSGSYMVQIREFCQPTIVVSSSGSEDNDVHTVGLLGNGLGDTHYEVGTANFNAVDGTAKVKLSSAGGTVVLVNSNGAISGGSIHNKTESINTTFSVTDTTFTIAGMTFAAVFGKPKKGSTTVEAMSWVGTTPDAGCMMQGEATAR